MITILVYKLFYLNITILVHKLFYLNILIILSTTMEMKEAKLTTGVSFVNTLCVCYPAKRLIDNDQEPIISNYVLSLLPVNENVIYYTTTLSVLISLYLYIQVL